MRRDETRKLQAHGSATAATARQVVSRGPIGWKESFSERGQGDRSRREIWRWRVWEKEIREKGKEMMAEMEEEGWVDGWVDGWTH